MPPYPGANLQDMLTAAVIAALAAAVRTRGACTRFAAFIRSSSSLPNPFVALTVGGVLLGVLGIARWTDHPLQGTRRDEGARPERQAVLHRGLALVTLVKVAALVIAGTCGFRGGRIFPSVFVGVAAGLFASSLLPYIPPALTVASGVLGILLAITRQGWLSLFMAVVVVPEADLIPCSRWRCCQPGCW